MKLHYTYCVLNDTLLPQKVAALQLQRSVPCPEECAEAACNTSPASEPELKSAVARLLDAAQSKGIEHNFSADHILSMLSKLIETRGNEIAFLRLRIYMAESPMLFIC